MKRWALNLLAAFCTALAVVAAVLWLESDRSHPVVRWNFIPHDPAAAASTYALRWSDDRLIISRLTYDFDLQVGYDLNRILGQAEHPNVTRRLTRPGFSFTFGQPSDVYPESSNPLTRRSSFAGLRWEKTDTRSNALYSSIRVLSLPAWLLPLLMAALPLVRMMHFLREMRWHRRLARGVCPKCRYDLRATPGRCPECGHRTLALFSSPGAPSP